MIHTPMTLQRLLLLTSVVFALISLPAAAAGQGASPPPKSFERKYIDPAPYRQDQIQLYDWPALTELVVWSRHLESAVAESDQTLAGELIAEFGGRVDSLQAQPLPTFLAGRADSIETTLTAIKSALERAEAAVAALPEAQVTPQPGSASADAERQRTLVTGSTAVTVPAGVAVGSTRDSLPTVAFEAGESVNFVDLVVLALLELDRVVHFTRSAGAQARAQVTEGPSVRETEPAPETPPRRSAP
jgi:hypothetical protein